MHLTEYWPKTQSWKKRLENVEMHEHKTARFLASLPEFLYISFYIPAAGPAYEMQPLGESDSISTKFPPASICDLPVSDAQ